MIQPPAKTAADLYERTFRLAQEHVSANQEDAGLFYKLMHQAAVVEFAGKRHIVFPQIEMTTSDVSSSVKNFLAR